MNEKILILEGNWAEEDDDYISNSCSATRIFTSVEALLSVHDIPIKIIQRPLLKCRYKEDIRQFVNLEANKKGINLIILSAHGEKGLKRKRGWRRIHSRKIKAIDGDINLSTGSGIKQLSSELGRTIMILDSCEVGKSLKSFKEFSGALGVIGFSKDVDWIDSAVFILALLLKYQSEKVFSKKVLLKKPKKILKEMEKGAYKLLMGKLGVEYEFD